VTVLPIDPTALLGGDFQLPGVGGLTPADTSLVGPDATAGTGTGNGFGSFLADEVGKLGQLQDTAATASQSLADGTATDASSVVVAVEKAQLAMQLAGQIRTKGAEAINDVFHTQI
jgi:flagellar hook-basal body complex protein FliE